MNMQITFPGGAKVDARFNDHTVHTDQPIAEGGADSAPAPFDLFLASLGTCTGYYVLMFCQKNSLPTEMITLVLRDERNPDTHVLESIHIDIRVPNDFPEKYRKALVRSAELCTVKRTFETPPKFDIILTKQ